MAAALLAGCTASAADVAPPQFDPYFPSAAVVTVDPRATDPGSPEKYLFILSADSDLRYDSGTILVYDLDEVQKLIDSSGAGCVPDIALPGVLQCDSSDGSGHAAPYAIAAAKVGNFGAGLTAQLLGNGKVRLFATVRGDPSLTWLDFDPATKRLECGDDASYPRCDSVHRLDRVRNDVTLGAIDLEPFGVTVDPILGRVFVTHLTAGHVTLASSPRDGMTPPRIEDVLGGLFAPDVNSLVGAVGVAVQHPGDADSLVYVGGHNEARIASLHVATGPVGQDGAPSLRLARGPSLFFSQIPTPGESGDFRNMAFTPSGDQLVVINRDPAEVMIVDTSLDATGAPKNIIVGEHETCPSPATLALADPGTGLRAYVPCFATGELLTYDLDGPTLLATAQVGRGPNGVAAAPVRKLVFVADYADDTVAVIDARPGSLTENHALLRLGRRRQ